MIQKVMDAMIDYDAKDAKRIQHFMKVYLFATMIATKEGLKGKELLTLQLAAIVHDIGIHVCEEKYGCCSGSLQEKEGPALARNLLSKCDVEETMIERICYLVGHHHSYENVDGKDYQILLESDFLVNAQEDELSQKAIFTMKEKVFQTSSGKSYLQLLYGDETA